MQATDLDMREAAKRWGQDNFAEWMDLMLFHHREILPFANLSAVQFLSAVVVDEEIRTKTRLYVNDEPIGVMRVTIDRETGRGVVTGFANE